MRSAEPVFIVGLYKNGTSWLLAALAAHRDFTALRELDILRSVASRDGSLLPARRRLASVFGRSAFCPLRAEQLAPGAYRSYLPAPAPRHVRSLYDLPADVAIEVIARMLSPERERRATTWAANGRPLGFFHFSPAILADAFDALRSACTVQAALDGFLAALKPGYPAGRRLVLKGADQILCLDELKRWRPAAPKIAIVRDGRDAAVSAFHYRQLMRERRMAWHHGYLSFSKPLAMLRDGAIGGVTAVRQQLGYGPDWRLGRSMAVWANRVKRVLAAAERGELEVLRYEDLLVDFNGGFTTLLKRLGADTSSATLDQVLQASSFESMSGRPRGIAGDDVVRKGVAGEWRTSLTAADRALAWRVAGAELEAMGYQRDGDPMPFQLRRHD